MTVNKILAPFSFLMIAVYLAIGILFIFSDNLHERFPEHGVSFGYVCIGFAVFRGTLLVIRLRKKEDE